MTRRWMIWTYVIMLFARYVYVEAGTCDILDKISSCRYTVLCRKYSGSAYNPTCNDEPYVTFQITDSNVENLSTGFFGSTNFDSRVRIFTATNNSWKNISPFAFKYYTKVIEMNISGNQIQEINNEAFKGLIALKYLNLTSNFIVTLYSYTFLVANNIQASALEILDLSNNTIKNIQSDTFTTCSNLRELYLQNNDIKNLDNNVLISLKNVTRLFLQNNHLTELNTLLINLQQLKELDVSYNGLTQLLGYETNRLTSLERVNLSNNMIKTIESNCFNQAFNLESLDLKNNNITSTISNIMFINNNILGYLDLYNNNISKIQENAFQHCNLSYLNLENNFISGEIAVASFAGLQKIKNLNLCKQNITFINANAFKEMTSLVKLNFSANSINVIDQSGFKSTDSIIVLDISHNHIKDLNFLKDALPHVTEMYLNNNEIVLIPSHSFANQTLLNILDISNNRIITIEQYSLPLCNLQYLNISGNSITGSLKSNVLSPGKYLRYLDLSNLNVTMIEDMALIDLPVLARLNLSYNAIEYIGQNNFLNLDNMFSLDISNNRLSNLKLNGTVVKRLTALYLNNNNLCNTTGVIPNATELMYLDISYNNVSDLSGLSFESLSGLRVLHASYNKISTFNNPQLNRLSKLSDLQLSSNQISVIDLRFFKELIRVDISNNNISYINMTLFNNLNNLQVLDISNNNISAIPPGEFRNSNSIKILNVSSNNLNNLRYGSLNGLHNTKVIDFSRNKIMDIDVDVFHECNELMTLILDYNRITYLDVQQLTVVLPKLMFLSIGGNPLDCKDIVRSMRDVNKTERSVTITSIYKIFHEDNVHGITCGNLVLSTTSTSVFDTSTLKLPANISDTSAVVIWCSVLTIFFIVLTTGLLYYYKRLYVFSYPYSQRSGQSRRSVELSGSEFQSDLLN